MFDDCQTIEQIERRKRSLVSELHPDVGGSNERFVAMMEAYRAALDRVNRPPKQPDPPPPPVYQSAHPNQPHPSWSQQPPVHHQEPSLADRLENTMAFIHKSIELAAKAAVVYTAVMDQLEAVKAEKRKKARKPRKKLPSAKPTNVKS
jgi:hypothetical protein